MRRFLCLLSLSVVLLSGIGCGAGSDGPKLPEAAGKKKEAEAMEEQKKAMEDHMKTMEQGQPPN